MKRTLPAILFVLLSVISAYATVSLSAIRSMYTGAPMALPAGTIISGTVISDRSGFNLPDHNAIIQDNTGGICVRFDLISPFNLGDSIVIDVSGDTLMEFNGLLEINYIPITSATLAGTGTIVPQTVTIADILNNMSGPDTWESILLRVNNATIFNDSSGIYSGADTLQDATGEMILFTRSLASFAGSALPAGQVNITGYISDFNLPEFIIRNISDVQILSSVFENQGTQMSISVYPNPGNGQIQVTSSAVIDQLEIRNVLGEIVYNAKPATKSVSLKLNADGMYFVSIIAGKDRVVEKVMVGKHLF